MARLTRSQALERRNRLEDWARENAGTSTARDVVSLIEDIDAVVLASVDNTRELALDVQLAQSRQPFQPDRVASAALSVVGRRLGGERR